MGARGEDIVVGAVWRAKRSTFRRVRIFEVDGDRCFVDRNSSRRTQAISRVALIRDYEFVRMTGSRRDI